MSAHVLLKLLKEFGKAIKSHFGMKTLGFLNCHIYEKLFKVSFS